MTVQPEDFAGLLGPDGAGKSTLIRILIGLSRPSAGSAKILDLDPLLNAHTIRHQIGYMPQASVLYEDLSPRDNLRFFGRPHVLSNLERSIDDVLDFTQLRERENDPVYGFSGGMRQRISLACALLHRPRILILDEPTAGEGGVVGYVLGRTGFATRLFTRRMGQRVQDVDTLVATVADSAYIGWQALKYADMFDQLDIGQ